MLNISISSDKSSFLLFIIVSCTLGRKNTDAHCQLTTLDSLYVSLENLFKCNESKCICCCGHNHMLKMNSLFPSVAVLSFGVS